MDTFLCLVKALLQATISKGFCSPNPAVGCVIVKDDKIVGQGYHHGPGLPHAEVEAIRQAGEQARGATLYVTLEPCCHHGKTPPCTELIIKTGIKQVYYGYRDPNPIVSGKGEQQLRAAGINCEFVEVAEINEFYRSYHHWHQTKLPWLTAKLALSLDGVYATSDHKPIQLTGEQAFEKTHQARKESDAILTTVNTIVADNPKFNARVGDDFFAKPLYIIDRFGDLPLDSHVFKTTKSITMFCVEDIEQFKFDSLTKHNVRCIKMPSKNGYLELNSVIKTIGQDGIHDLWCEAGGNFITALQKAELINELWLYVAPKIIGDGLRLNYDIIAQKFDSINWQNLGNDGLCQMKLLGSDPGVRHLSLAPF